MAPADRPPPKPQSPQAQREARLAEALRANLRKRKAGDAGAAKAPEKDRD